MPKALAAMMFGTAYLAAIVAFSGVVICAVWRSSTPTLSNIPSCLALWWVSGVY